MFFDIAIQPSYIKHRVLYNRIVTSGEECNIFNDENISTDENTSTEEKQYLFWVTSMGQERRKFTETNPDLAEEKLFHTNVVLEEAEEIIYSGMLRGEQGYHVLVYYEKDAANNFYYIGSVLYLFIAGKGIPYKKRQDGGYFRATTPEQRTMFFVGIYKTILHTCRTCT